MYIDTCGHVAWQIKHKTKHQNNHTKGETQIPQPDMRFAIQQRSKKTRQIMEKPPKRQEIRQQRRHANLQARFAFRQQRKQRNNTKWGRSHTRQKTTQSMEIVSDTIG